MFVKVNIHTTTQKQMCSLLFMMMCFHRTRFPSPWLPEGWGEELLWSEGVRIEVTSRYLILTLTLLAVPAGRVIWRENKYLAVFDCTCSCPLPSASPPPPTSARNDWCRFVMKLGMFSSMCVVGACGWRISHGNSLTVLICARCVPGEVACESSGVTNFQVACCVVNADSRNFTSTTRVPHV